MVAKIGARLLEERGKPLGLAFEKQSLEEKIAIFFNHHVEEVEIVKLLVIKC